MSGVLMDDVFTELVTWTLSIIYPVDVKIDTFEPVMQSAVTYAHHFLCYGLMWINGLRLVLSEISLFKRSQFRSFVACLNAVVKLFTIFGNLLMVDKRYSSLAIILIILLMFVVALFVIVSRKGHLELDANKADDGIIIATKITKADGRERGEAGDIISVEGSSSTTEDHSSGNKKLIIRGEEKKSGEVGHEVRLLCMLLCFMRYFRNTMETTNCLLFLTCSLGELTLMMERLPSESDVAPAFEVIHRAFLLMGLMTAHTMAAELLGEYVLLVCMPVLVASLAWLTIYLGSCDDDAAASAVRAVKKAVRIAELPLLCLAGILASIIVKGDTDEAEGEATDLLLGNMSSAIVAVLSSVILPSLCMLVLRQWQRQTTAAAPSSSELEGVIRLLSLCRDVPCKALVMFFLAKQMLLADTLVVPLMFSVFCLILLVAASMYARAHGLHGLRVRAAGHGEKRD